MSHTAPSDEYRPEVVGAVGGMVIATILLALLDAVAKVLGTRYPVTELVWVRMAVHLLLAIAIFYPRRGIALFRTDALLLQLAKSTLLVTTGILFFLGLRFLPLAETAAITFSSPVITLVLAGPLLHERITGSGIAATLVGFAGVLAVIQPFSGSVSPAVLLPLAAAFSASLYALLTRKVGAGDAPSTTWFYTAVVGTFVMPLTSPLGWVMPGPLDAMLLGMLGVLGGFGHLAVINAYRRAAASLIAPLGYLGLAWTALLGLAFFAEFPNAVALVGMGAIAVSGGIIASHGRRGGAAIEAH